MKRNSVVSICAGVLLAALPAFSEVVPVYTGAANWYYTNDNTNATTSFTAIASPSPGDATYQGSADMTTDAGGVDRPYVWTSIFAGLQLNTITSLSYESYSVSGSAGTDLLEPTLQLDVANSASDASFHGRLVFDPYLMGVDPTASTWTTWNPLTTAGGWFFSSSAEANTAGSSTCINNGNGALHTSACSLATILANDPNLYVSSTLTQFGFRTGGSGVTENSYVDQLTLGTSAGTTTYDFTPAPEPSTWAMSLIAFGGLVFVARKRVAAKG